MMKKASIVFVAVLSLFLVGCGKDISKQVIGKWKMNLDTAGVPEKDKAGLAMITQLMNSISIEFKENGVIATSAMGQTREDGTWKVADGQLTITAAGLGSNGNQATKATVSSDGKRIDLEMSADDKKQLGGGSVYLTKVEESK